MGSDDSDSESVYLPAPEYAFSSDISWDIDPVEAGTKFAELSFLQPGLHVENVANEIQGALKPLEWKTNGAFADVWYGQWTKVDGTVVEVAIKTLRQVKMQSIRNRSEERRRRIDLRMRREATVWQKAAHRNILPFYGFRSGDDPCLVSPWCAKGNLYDFIGSKPDLGPIDKLLLVLQASRGLAYLHSLEPPICHGDIKPQNILVNDEGEAVVSDFGLARVLNVLGDHSGFTTSSVGQGTKGYLAPELLNEDDARPTVQTDVFSFGGLILAVMSKKEPFADIDTTKAIINVAQGQMPTPDEHRLLPKESALWTVIRKCWSFLPDERITMSAVAQTLENIADSMGASE